MHRPTFLSLALVATLALSGCVAETGSEADPAVPLTSANPVAPLTQPTAEATAAAAAPAVATLLISSASVTTADGNGTTVGVTDFVAGPVEMVSFLTTAIGTEPVVTQPEDGDDECRGPATRYSWGTDLVVFSPVTENPPHLVWSVQARAATVDGIAIRSSDGFAVGDEGTALIDATAADNKTDEYGDSTGTMLFDVHSNADGTRSSGAALVTTEGLIGAIVAPATTSEFYC